MDAGDQPRTRIECPSVKAMNRRLIRRLALALIALLAFAQASVVLAACSMERGEMARMATATTGDDCCGPGPEFQPAPQLTNDCLAHCTADLQLCGAPPALVRGPADAPVLLWPDTTRSPPLRAGSEAPPARTIPSRILLHSFLI